MPASQADREFVGKDWFGYLLSKPLTPFRIRIRENYKLNDGRQSLKIGVVFADLQPGQTKILRHQRCLWAYWLYIAALRLDDGSLLVVATQAHPHQQSLITPKDGELKRFSAFSKLVGFAWNPLI